MILIYTHENLTLVVNMQEVLANAGIKSRIKNQFSQGGRGEIPCFETWPELWIENSKQQDQAKKLVEQVIKQPEKPDWICQQCHEPNGDAFEFCWQCNSQRRYTV